MKKVLLAAAIVAMPVVAQAQSMFSPGPANPGLYVGVEGGANFLLNSSNFNSDVGYAVGGVVGYDFVGPRVELEGMFRSNNGRSTVNFGNVFTNSSGRVEQLTAMANVLYDFFPGATITPYVGVGAGIAFADRGISGGTVGGCSLCSTQFAYQGIVGVSYNITQSLRLNLDGRYYATTRGDLQYENNNITAMLGLTYKVGQPQTVAAAAPPPAPAQPAPPSFMVFFDFDRSDLSAQAQSTIQQAAGAYKTKGSARVTATGHADKSGPDAYNMALSLRRANTVKDALVRNGVPATAIAVVGRGESMPLVQTADGVREPQNRRVEIVIQ